MSKGMLGTRDPKGGTLPTGYDVSRRDGVDEKGDHIGGCDALCETSAAGSLGEKEAIGWKIFVCVCVRN